MTVASRERVLNGALEAGLEKVAALHPRLCPRQVLGVRMGLRASELLDLEVPRVDKRLHAIVETDGCFADGVSVASGCWLGRRTLRLADYGKVAVTFIDTLTGRAVRVWPHPLARTAAERYAGGASNRWQAQLIGYQGLPADELLCAQHVEVTDPVASLMGQAGRRERCASCGEEIINQRAIATWRGVQCRGCATGVRYYRGVGCGVWG